MDDLHRLTVDSVNEDGNAAVRITLASTFNPVGRS